MKKRVSTRTRGVLVVVLILVVIILVGAGIFKLTGKTIYPLYYPLKLGVDNIGTSGNYVQVSLNYIGLTPATFYCRLSSCQYNILSGKRVTLTAITSGTSNFRGWSGACTGTGACTITMNSPQTATASFVTTSPDSYQLRVSVSVPQYSNCSGNIVSNPTGLVTHGIDCGPLGGPLCADYFTRLTTVTLKETPLGQATCKFKGWGGDCSGTATFFSVYMNSPKSCVGYFGN